MPHLTKYIPSKNNIKIYHILFSPHLIGQRASLSAPPIGQIEKHLSSMKF